MAWLSSTVRETALFWLHLMRHEKKDSYDTFGSERGGGGNLPLACTVLHKGFKNVQSFIQ